MLPPSKTTLTGIGLSPAALAGACSAGASGTSSASLSVKISPQQGQRTRWGRGAVMEPPGRPSGLEPDHDALVARALGAGAAQADLAHVGRRADVSAPIGLPIKAHDFHD